ncbi:MAG TPA: hypothetical protein VF372_01980, partial [Thermodesulfobacteriota bacterium]
SQRGDFCSRAIPEIPPSPPFSKGGLRGFQRIVAERTFTLQNLKSLRVSSIEHGGKGGELFI